MLLHIHETTSHFSYKVTPETGYVAEVRYEGAAVVAEPIAKSERLQRPPQQARPQGRPQRLQGA